MGILDELNRPIPGPEATPLQKMRQMAPGGVPFRQTRLGAGIKGVLDFKTNATQGLTNLAQWANNLQNPDPNVGMESALLGAMNVGGLGMIGGPKAAGWNEAEGKFSSLYDKKPRFEIDDSGAVFNPDIVKNRLSVIEALKGFKDGFGRSADLGDILDHDELFNNYPDAKGIKAIAGSSGAGASYNHKTNTITIDTQHDLITDNEVKETLLHEIQHAIQNREGFAKGGDPRSFAMSKTEAAGIDRQIEDLNGLLKENVGKPEYEDIMNEKMQLVKYYQMHTPEAAYKKYRNLAGEIEARDTAARSGFTPEQRAKIPPYSSENIPVKDAITMFGDKSQPDAAQQTMRLLKQKHNPPRENASQNMEVGKK